MHRAFLSSLSGALWRQAAGRGKRLQSAQATAGGAWRWYSGILAEGGLKSVALKVCAPKNLHTNKHTSISRRVLCEGEHDVL